MNKISRFNFAPKTLKAKLLVMSLVSAGAALLVAVAVLAVYDYHEIRRGLVIDTQTYANIIAENSNADLSFADPNDAARLLASLRAEPHVVTAAIYDNSQQKLASYFRDHSARLPDFSPWESANIASPPTP